MEKVGGEYLEVGIEPCENHACILRDKCSKIALSILKQKYYGDNFGIKEPKIVLKPNSDLFSSEDNINICSDSYPALYDRGSLWLLIVGGHAVALGPVKCNIVCAPPQDTDIVYLKAAIVEYNYKKRLEEEWK